MAQCYRVIVVGRGLIGAATTRHLAETADGILAIGPDEPSNKRTHNGPFGAYFDEGRITRILDVEPVWAELAIRSIERYHAIEQASGIRFFTEAGYIDIAPNADQEYLEALATSNATHAAGADWIDAAEIARRFPYLRPAPGSVGFHQRRQAGYINPRRLREAALKLAEQAGAQMKTDEVVCLRQVGGGVEVETSNGAVFTADRAAIAIGAFTNFRLVTPRPLAMHADGRIVVLFELDENASLVLADMPALIYGHPMSDGSTFNVYATPPMRYPDGRMYLKAGSSDDEHPLLTREDSMRWFRGEELVPAEAVRKRVCKVFRQLVPAIAMSATQIAHCAYAVTPSGRPYIGAIDPEGRVVVATGCNGYAAKSCDEIGRIAARLVLDGEWTSRIDPALVRPLFV